MQTSIKRVALVTGANRGIGFEIARQLAHKKLTVLIGARDNQKGAAACEKLTGPGMDVRFVLLDVTNPTSIHAALGRIQDEIGRLDVLVNNAGILLDGKTSILQLGITLLQNTLETNVFGPLLLSQACIPMMKAHGYGRIVNISSSMGSLAGIAHPESGDAQILSPAYRMSKTLLNAVTVLLAKELRGTNILINSACPGWVRTEMGGDQAPLSPQQGAATPVWLATLPDDGPTGGFFRDRQPVPW
jgi:NAD(P)-dependent dehydrogenase (short-subunit alcohol dehydrogenase family)